MAVIRIHTEIPGPRSRALMARRKAAVPRGIAHSTAVFAASAEGLRVTDVDGNVFLDFAGGIGVMNVGHTDPGVVEAVTTHAKRFTHTCFSDVIRFLTPLVISDDELDEGLDVVTACLAAAASHATAR